MTSVSFESTEIDDGLDISFAQGRRLHPESSMSTFVCIGDIIEEEDISELLKGHGIQSVDGKLIATVCGRTERINKLVSVRPLRARYTAEVGDVVVGRVVGIVGGQWKVDINGRQDASMGLTSVFLPGQVHRRKTIEDEANMRSVFRESDLMAAEIQTVRHDGGTSLHTRSEKYGKLANGQLTVVSASLVQRQRQHFHTLEDLGATIVFGCNGYIWIAPLPGKIPLDREDCLKNVARLSSAVRVLEKLGFPVYRDSVLSVHDLSVQAEIKIPDMELPTFLTLVAETEFLKRQK